jgi:hypothetical protein
MNDEPTPPAFFRPATPKKKDQLKLLNESVDIGLATNGSPPGQPPEELPRSDSPSERRFTLGEALKIVSGLRTEDLTRFMLIASSLEEMPADGRKRVVDTLARIFR